MPAGGCFCGNVRYEVQGESGGNVRGVVTILFLLLMRSQILCHCLDCRKITGSAYSTNAVYSDEGFKVTKGTPKAHTVKGDSGNDVTSMFWYVFATV